MNAQFCNAGAALDAGGAACSMTMRLLFLYSLPAAAATVAPCALAGHRSTLPKKVVNGSVERIEFVQLPGNDSFTLRTTDWDTQPVKGLPAGAVASDGQVVPGTAFVDILMPTGPPWAETRWTISSDCNQLCVGARASCSAGGSNWCRFPHCPFAAPSSWPAWGPATPAPPSPPFGPPPPAPPEPEPRLTCGSRYGWGGSGVDATANGSPCPEPIWTPTWQRNLSTAIANTGSASPQHGATWGLVTYAWNLNQSVWQDLFPHPGEAMMTEQCRRVKAFGTGNRCMVYRQNELSLQWQETSRAAQTSENVGMYLQYKTKQL